MTEHPPRPAKVRVSDKRKLFEQNDEGAGAAHSDSPPDETEARADHPSGTQPSKDSEHDYLDDLRRVQAEFDNFRKRMMREQTEIASRASARLIERLLPVLDNFERALDHSDDDGMVLVHKELLSVLEAEGLSAIDALGAPFDPNLHEAVESHEEDGVTDPTVVEVYRTGYELKGKVLRAALVVVARPVETAVNENNVEAADNTEAEESEGD